MGFLDRIKSSFSGSGTASSVLGIDIGSSAIKVVQLRREKGHAILETYGEIALGPYAQTEVGRATHLGVSDVARALKDVLREANVTATSAGVSIPFSASLTSVITLPKLDQKQLARMIPLEARKYIPANINDVMLDWIIIPDDDDENEWSRTKAERVGENGKMQKTEVLIVAIHNEELSNFQAIMNEVQLDVGFYELEIFGAMRSSLENTATPTMVVDMGAATTKVYIVERGIVRLSHLINLGSQDMTLAVSRSLGWTFDRAERMKRELGLMVREGANAEEDTNLQRALLSTLGRIFSDVNRVLLSYEKKYGRNVSRMVLTGGGSGLPNIVEYIAKNVPIDIVLSQPFEKVQAPAFLDDVLAEVGPEFAVAVGVALRRMQM